MVSSYDQNVVGLGKLMIFNDEEEFLFGEITASPSVDTLMGNELTSRLWLQDGVVINNKLYIFPILVKDEGEAFKVHNVGLIETPIINERIRFEQANYYSTPLQVKTEDGGTKVSLRSKTSDVNTLAKHFGGGGHTYAAGITSKKPLSVIRDEMIKLL